MSKDDLTDRRLQILECIIRTTQERGYPPTVREIVRGGLHSSRRCITICTRWRRRVPVSATAPDSALRSTAVAGAQRARLVPLLGKVAAESLSSPPSIIEDKPATPEGLFPDGDPVFSCASGATVCRRRDPGRGTWWWCNGGRALRTATNRGGDAG